MYGAAMQPLWGFENRSIVLPEQALRHMEPIVRIDADQLWIRQSRRASLSIVEIVIVLRRRCRRTLHELRRVMARFAWSRTLGRIAADLGL